MSFRYNNLKNRVKKEIYNTCGTLLDTINFYYDEKQLLIHQKSNDLSLTLLYDELNEIYGFIHNNNRYYYIKDKFKTILGIVDLQRNDIVKYNYDAWGNIISINDTSGINLAAINPIRYKCYYYDEEEEDLFPMW